MKKKLCAIMLFFLVGYYGIAGAEWYFRKVLTGQKKRLEP